MNKMSSLEEMHDTFASDTASDHQDASEIQNYFRGKTVFLTGATGFLGKVLIEKLLRTCSGVERIYLLVREKKGKEPSQRLKELFDVPAFGPLKKQMPHFVEKLSLCVGDCLKPNLGLSQKDLEVLKTEVGCVLHCAATVRFDETLRNATYINVRGVRDLLRIAKDMKQLTSFIHVSTAFSHCPKSDIDEVIYESPISGDRLMELVDVLSDDVLATIAPVMLQGWPNTYSFTKAVAEEVVKIEGKGLPISILRPSVVIASFKEPVPGWIDNVYGPTGILIARAVGLMRIQYCDDNKKGDVVPADYVINAILASAWNVGQRRFSEIPETTVTTTTDPMVYNYVSGCQNPLTCGSFRNLITKYGNKTPTLLTIWYPFIINCNNLYVHLLCDFLLHTVPGYIVDFTLVCMRKKPLLMDGHKRIKKYLNVISYFITQQWNFKDTNVQNLWNKLNDRDRELFEFDIKKIDWDAYFKIYVLGCRVYLLKDPVETLPQAKRKFMFFKIAHYTLLAVLGFLLFFLLKFLFKSAF